MNIISLFRNLGKAEEVYSSLNKLTPMMPRPLDDWAKDMLLEAAHRDIEHLNQVIIRALTERKTPSVTDFTAQLNSVLEANAAVVHQRFLGVHENTEMTKILNKNLQEEIAKLKFLAFETKCIPAEEAEKIVKGYV